MKSYPWRKIIIACSKKSRYQNSNKILITRDQQLWKFPEKNLNRVPSIWLQSKLKLNKGHAVSFTIPEWILKPLTLDHDIIQRLALPRNKNLEKEPRKMDGKNWTKVKQQNAKNWLYPVYLSHQKSSYVLDYKGNERNL